MTTVNVTLNYNSKNYTDAANNFQTTICAANKQRVYDFNNGIVSFEQNGIVPRTWKANEDKSLTIPFVPNANYNNGSLRLQLFTVL